MHSITKRQLRKVFWINSPYVVTAVIWIFAKVELESLVSPKEVLRLVSQLLALIGLVMLSQSYLLSTRIRILENFYGGLDKLYFTHSILGKLSFLLIIAHPLLLIFYNLPDLSVVLTLIVPFISSGSVPKTLGILSLYTYTILIIVTIVRFLPYHIWKKTHSLIGIPFILAAFHGLGAESDVKYYLPLKLWTLFWIIVGIWSYVYKLFLYRHYGPKYEYKVEKVNSFDNGIGEIYLRPQDKRINFEPGEFVFVSFKSNEWISSEDHPFSISSSPSQDFLRISYKELGDYTKTLKHAKEDDLVDIFGPYGEFTSYVLNSYKKQIWIAAGIGVTPFISMLEYESRNYDKKEIHFYYCAKNDSELVYDKEIKEIIKSADDKINYETICSSKHDRLTAHKISEDIKDLSEFVVLLCGPVPMMKNLKEQLIEKGVAEELIVFEEFNFR